MSTEFKQASNRDIHIDNSKRKSTEPSEFRFRECELQVGTYTLIRYIIMKIRDLVCE